MALPIFRNGYGSNSDYRTYEAIYNSSGDLIEVSGFAPDYRFDVSFALADYASVPPLSWPTNPTGWITLSNGGVQPFTSNPEGHNRVQAINVALNHTSGPLAIGSYSIPFNVTQGATGPAFTITGTINMKVFPAKTTLTSPGGYTGPIPHLEWGSVPGADNYQIQISTDPGFGTIVYTNTGNFLSVDPTLPLNPTPYYWRVRTGTVSDGFGSFWSATSSFETGFETLPGFRNLIASYSEGEPQFRNLIVSYPGHHPELRSIVAAYDETPWRPFVIGINLVETPPITQGDTANVNLTIDFDGNPPGDVSSELYWSPTGLIGDIEFIGSAPSGGPHSFVWNTTLFTPSNNGKLFARAADLIDWGPYFSGDAFELNSPPSTVTILTPAELEAIDLGEVIPLTWTDATDANDPDNTLRYNIQIKRAGEAVFSDVPGLPESGGGFGLTVADDNDFDIPTAITDPDGTWTIRVRAYDGKGFGAFAYRNFVMTEGTAKVFLGFYDPDTMELVEQFAWEWTDPEFRGFVPQPRVRQFDGNITVNRQVSKADARRGMLEGVGTVIPDAVGRRLFEIVGGWDDTQDWHRMVVKWTDLFLMEWKVTIKRLEPVFVHGLMEWNWEFEFLIEEMPPELRTGCD